MTKYFDKLLKIKWISLIKIYLFNVKKLKEDIHLNKSLRKNLNLNVLIIL